MSRKIIGVTVGTNLSPQKMREKIGIDEAGYATEEYVRNKIAEAELGGKEVDLSGYAQKSELPTKVSQLENDKGYLTEHQDISGKLDASALPEAVNDALAQAKASGEFDGKDGVDGKDGQDGYTPQKGIDYFDGQPGKDGADGYTPVKGKDYFDGEDGQPGTDGVSPTVAVSKSGKVTTVSITDKNGTKTATINDGADGSPGSAGKDGTSVTVKSVSESTADGGSNVVTFSDGKTVTIKNGSKGSPGTNGSDASVTATNIKNALGYTPADDADVRLLSEKIAVKALTKIEYSALTAEEITQYYNAGIRLIVVEDGYTNLVPKSTDAAGNVYRGCGYRNGYRLTSSGDMAVSDNCCVSGFMPYTHGSTIRIVGSCGDVLSNGGQYVGVYDANHNLIKMDYASSITATWEPRADSLWEMTINTSKMTAWSSAKYFRVSCLMCVGADMVVTVNEPIGLEV